MAEPGVNVTRFRPWLLAILVVAFGCSRKQVFPGYTYVASDSAQRGFVDLDSVRSDENGVTFSFISQRPPGEYAILTVFSDCSAHFRRTGGTWYERDGTLLGTVPPDGRLSLLSTDAVLTAAASAACGDEVIPQPAIADGFDPKLALQAYGSYDPQSQTTLWKGVAVPSSLIGGWGAVSEGLVSVAFDSAYREGGIDKHIVITWTVPVGEKYDCRVCIRPFLGAIVFSRRNGIWSEESEEKYLTVGAPFGKRPRCQLVKLGPEKFGIVMHTGSMSMAGEWEGIEMVALSGGTVRSILKLTTREDPNDSTCSRIKVNDESCTHYSVGYRFAPGSNPDYFDVIETKRVLSGPNASSTSTKRLTFAGDKFVPSDNRSP